jgi:hypothetical protein
MAKEGASWDDWKSEGICGLREVDDRAMGARIEARRALAAVVRIIVLEAGGWRIEMGRQRDVAQKADEGLKSGERVFGKCRLEVQRSKFTKKSKPSKTGAPLEARFPPITARLNL